MDLKPNQVYERRKHTENDGKEYEESLLAFYSIILLDQSLDDTWIATNADACGDFDDVVIYRKNETEELYMIQCKHLTTERNIGVSSFLTPNTNTKKQFFLEKYITSYNDKIRPFQSSSNSLDVGTTIQRLNDSLKCVIFTNKEVDAKEILEDAQDNSLLFLNTEGNISKFNLGLKINELVFKSTINKIIADDTLYDIISKVTLDKILVAQNITKQASKICLGEIIEKEKFKNIIQKLTEYKSSNKANSLKGLSKIVEKKLNTLLTTKLSAIISDSKLNDVISNQKLDRSVSKKKIDNKFSKTNLSSFIAYKTLNKIIFEGLQINYRLLDEKLFLFSNQMDNQSIRRCVNNKLNELVPLCTCSNLNNVVEKYMLFIKEWANGNLGGHYLLTKAHVVAKLTELLLERFTIKFYEQKYEVDHVRDNVRTWHMITEDKNIIVVNVNEDDGDVIIWKFLYLYLLDIVKKYHINQSYIDNWDLPFSEEDHRMFYEKNTETLLGDEIIRTVGVDKRISLHNLYRILWKLKKVPLVLKVNTAKDYNEVLQVLKISEYTLKTIIINTSKSKLSSHVDGTFVNLADLNENLNTEIIEEIVQLQGKSIQLKCLIEKHEFLRTAVMARDVIEILATDGTFTIGTKFNDLPKYFIPRTITRNLLDLTKFVEILNDLKSAYVVKCHSKNFFLDYIKASNLQIDSAHVIDYTLNEKVLPSCTIVITNKLLSDEDIFMTKFPDKTIHHLAFDEDHKLEWLKTTGTTGSIYAIKSCIDVTHSNTINAKDVLNHFLNKINIISAVPGMGKSVIMDYIAREAPTNKWVLRINLNEHRDYFKSELHSNPKVHLKHFNAVVSKTKGKAISVLNQEVFNYFLETNSLLVLLDGFDEISPDYKLQVTNMIKSLLSTEHRIWLSTRPSQKLYVESEFNAIAVTLNPFTQENQSEFLFEYFKSSLNEEPNISKIQELLDLAKTKLDRKQEFTSVPLQIMMLADVFKNDFAEKRNFNLIENFDVLYLYETFFAKKIEILKNRHGDRVQIYETYQQLHALTVVFSEKDLEELKINDDLAACSKTVENIKELAEYCGILVDGSRSSFAHRTYAEYFAARWLTCNLTTPSVKKLIKKLFKERYFFVRNMFDRILGRNCHLHTLILNNQLDAAVQLIETNSDTLNNKDKGGRLACHIAASWGIRHPMPDPGELVNFETHQIPYYTKDEMVDVLSRICYNIRDTILDLTPLDYAIYTDCLANLNAILGVSRLGNNIDLDKNKTKPYLYYCAKYGYTSLFKVIVKDVTEMEPARDSDSVDVNTSITVNDCTALHVAVTSQQREILQLLLSAGANFNARDKYKQTALHYAVRKGYIDIMSFLISNGTDIHAADDDQRTILHHASKNCSLETIEFLLSKGSDIHAVDNDGRTPLQQAVKGNCLDIAILLLSYGADIEEKDYNGCSALRHAVKHGYFDIMELLLFHGANINSTNNRGRTALHYVAKNGLETTASKLIDNGANVELKDDDGKTALIHAAEGGHLDIVKMLVSKDADIDSKDNGFRTALQYASKAGHVHVEQFLVSNGANIPAANNFEDTKDAHSKDENGKTPLHLATENGNPDTVFLIYWQGVGIEEKDKDGDTALRLAIKKGRFDVMEVLLSVGADINSTNHRCRTALHHAAKKGLTKNVSILLSKDADLEVKDKDGETALHLALKKNVFYLQKNVLEIVKLLVSKGADVNSRDYRGRSVLHHAKARKFKKIISFLIANGADDNAKNIFDQNTDVYFGKYTTNT